MSCDLTNPVIVAGNGVGCLTVGILSSRCSIPVCKTVLEKFSNGECRVLFEESVRCKDVIIVQKFSNHVSIKNSKDTAVDWTFNDFLVELFCMVDCAVRGEAKSITVVVPYFPYMRSDKKDGRTNIGTSMMAMFLESYGVKRIISMDLHNAASQSAFRTTTLHNLYAMKPLADYVNQVHVTDREKTVIISPDNGGMKRVDAWASYLKLRSVPMHKSRDYSQASVVQNSQVLGDVSGCRCIIVDDIGDTLGTLVLAADRLKQCGAESVIAVVTHGVFSGNAVEKLRNSQNLDGIICADTVGHIPSWNEPKISVVSVLHVFADTIGRLKDGRSISEMFE